MERLKHKVHEHEAHIPYVFIIHLTPQQTIQM